MYRAGGDSSRLSYSAIGDSTDVAQGLVARLGECRFNKPLHMRPVQPVLIDSLGRAALAQFRRAVSGQYQQRHMGQFGLDNGGPEVFCSRARGAEQGYWLGEDVCQG